jgi:transposase-like protein
LPIIRDHVFPGTKVYSDEWRSYKALSKSGYTHHTVNHSINFVNPDNYVDTNTIESIWCKAKRKFKQMIGIQRNYLQDYLDEFVWREIYASKRSQCYLKVLNVIRDSYNVKLNDKAEDEDEEDEENEKEDEDQGKEKYGEQEEKLSQSFSQLELSIEEKEESRYQLRKRIKISYKI